MNDKLTRLEQLWIGTLAVRDGELVRHRAWVGPATDERDARAQVRLRYEEQVGSGKVVSIFVQPLVVPGWIFTPEEGP